MTALKLEDFVKLMDWRNARWTGLTIPIPETRLHLCCQDTCVAICLCFHQINNEEEHPSGVVLGLGPWSLVVLKDKVSVLGPGLGLEPRVLVNITGTSGCNYWKDGDSWASAVDRRTHAPQSLVFARWWCARRICRVGSRCRTPSCDCRRRFPTCARPPPRASTAAAIHSPSLYNRPRTQTHHAILVI